MLRIGSRITFTHVLNQQRIYTKDGSIFEKSPLLDNKYDVINIHDGIYTMENHHHPHHVIMWWIEKEGEMYYISGTTQPAIFDILV